MRLVDLHHPSIRHLLFTLQIQSLDDILIDSKAGSYISERHLECQASYQSQYEPTSIKSPLRVMEVRRTFPARGMIDYLMARQQANR